MADLREAGTGPTKLPPPPELTPGEKLVYRAKGIERLDRARLALSDAIRDFGFSADESTEAAVEEIVGEIGAIVEGLAVGQ